MVKMVRKRGVARRSFSHRRVRRVKKYDHHVIPKRFKIYLPHMEPNWEDEAPPFVECETPTMELLEALGVASDEWQYYLGFMKRMIELYLNFTAETLQKEKDSLIAEYVYRGKDKEVLEAVQEQAAECAGVIVEMDLWTRDFYKLIQPQSIDGFSWSVLGTGSYSLVEGEIFLSTGGANGSWSAWWDEIMVPLVDLGKFLTWDKERRMRVGVKFEANTNQLIYIHVGIHQVPDNNWFGFKIVDNQIFGCVSNVGGEVLTGALKSFNAGDEFILEARLKPNQECRFYIDGVEVGVLTTSLPSGLNNASIIAYIQIFNTADEDKIIEFDWWEFYQKR